MYLKGIKVISFFEVVKPIFLLKYIKISKIGTIIISVKNVQNQAIGVNSFVRFHILWVFRGYLDHQ